MKIFRLLVVSVNVFLISCTGIGINSDTHLSDSEIEKLFSGKTEYVENKLIFYYQSNHRYYVKHRKSQEQVSGIWGAKNGSICFHITELPKGKTLPYSKRKFCDRVSRTEELRLVQGDVEGLSEYKKERVRETPKIAKKEESKVKHQQFGALESLAILGGLAIAGAYALCGDGNCASGGGVPSSSGSITASTIRDTGGDVYKIQCSNGESKWMRYAKPGIAYRGKRTYQWHHGHSPYATLLPGDYGKGSKERAADYICNNK